MLAAILTTICWALSVTFAHRSAKMIGGSEANFWRLSVATLLLGSWAYGFGKDLQGDSLPLFFWSGVIGIGVGDVALFQALPRLGSRVTILIVQCLSTPFAILIEWLWLGTRLTSSQFLFGALILTGVAIALTPFKHLKISRQEMTAGILFAVLAALGNAFGAVLSRKGYVQSTQLLEQIDGGTAAFQRLTGGLFVAGLWLVAVKFHSKTPPRFASASEKYRRVWPWVLANGVAGQTLGNTFYLLALARVPTGIVLPIIATTPLVIIPFSRLLEAERPTKRSILGAVLAVGGVIGLVMAR